MILQDSNRKNSVQVGPGDIYSLAFALDQFLYGGGVSDFERDRIVPVPPRYFGLERRFGLDAILGGLDWEQG